MASNYSGMFPHQNDWRDQQTVRGLQTLAQRPGYQQRPDPVNPAAKVEPQRYRRPVGGGMTPQNPLTGGTRQTGLTPSNRATSAPQSLAQSQAYQGQRPPGSLAAMEAALSQRPDFQALGRESGYSPRGFGEFVGEVGRLGGLGAVRGAQGIADYWQSITTPKENYRRPEGFAIPQTQQARQATLQQRALAGQQGADAPGNIGPQAPYYNPATGRDANPPSLGQRAIANQRLGGAEITEGPAGFQRQVFQGGPPLAQGEQRLMGQAPARTRYVSDQGYAEFQGTPARQPGGFVGAQTNAQAAARLADYRSRGLSAQGNDLSEARRLNAVADQMQQSRLANIAGNPEYSIADREQARQTLATLQQGTQIQQQGQQAQQQAAAAAQQRAIDNTLAFERLGLDQDKFNAQVEKDGRVDLISFSEQIAESYDPINAPEDADGNPVDLQTYIRDTMNAMFQAIGLIVDPNGQVYSAGEIQSVADQYFGGDVEAARRDMQAKGFLGI